MASRRKFTAAFKLKVALDAVQERNTLAELCQKYHLTAAQIRHWKRRLIDEGDQIFESPSGKSSSLQPPVDELHRVIGELQAELSFLKKTLNG